MNQNPQNNQRNIQQIIKNGYQQQPQPMQVQPKPQPTYPTLGNPQVKYNQPKKKNRDIDLSFLKNKNTKNILFGIISVVAVAVVAFMFITLTTSGETQEQRDAREKREIVSEINAIAIVPQDAPLESITVAKINDINLILSNSANAVFFENGKNGDYFVIYNNHSKVILYRRSERKIVNIASTRPQEITPGEGISQ